MLPWKTENGMAVVHKGNTQDVVPELPLVSVTAQVEVWEWVLANLPRNDGVTQDIQAIVREAVQKAFPTVFTTMK